MPRVNPLWSAILYNSSPPGQNGRHFAEDIFKRIFLNENVCISIKISRKFVPKGSFNNIPPLVQIMAWGVPGDKPLSEPMMLRLPTHICITRPQWDKAIWSMCLRSLTAKEYLKTCTKYVFISIPTDCLAPKYFDERPGVSYIYVRGHRAIIDNTCYKSKNSLPIWRIMYRLEWRTVDAHTKGLFWCYITWHDEPIDED